MTNPQKTPKEIRRAANLAMVAMAFVIVAVFKNLITEPKTITNREIVMMPNDSLIALQRENARLHADNSSLRLVADTRAQIIYNITSPLQGLTDSMLRLQRMARADIQANRDAIAAEEPARDRRVTELKNHITAVYDSRPDIVEVIHEHSEAIRELITTRDTVYVPARQESKKFWERVKDVFRRQK